MMRSFIAAGIVATFTGCIAIPIPTVHVHTSEQRVHAGLASLKSRVLAAAGKLRGVPCPAGNCYAAGDVARLLADIRNAANKVFPPEAAGLRESLDGAIPRIRRRPEASGGRATGPDPLVGLASATQPRISR
ncbi:MAG TPA: hypothetical protein VEU30_00610, partial [Thermoanaerobaculia bacterium]|nr:hypothetical protein [Thermoanaerobaculia bacterium]